MPRFQPDTLALTALMALLVSIGPIATDMYLPVLPEIRAGLGATTAQTQATLSGYLAGYALAQLFYGPLSDRRGRRPIMLVGMALFTIGSIACTFAPTIEVLIGARIVQSFGGAGSIVLARAAVRDLYDGPRAGRELARMGSLMALVPALAPILGAGVGILFGWRAVFVCLALFGPLLAGLVLWKMPETLKQPLTDPFSLKAMLGDFRIVFRDRTFRVNTLLGGLSFAGFMGFLSSGSFVLQGHYGWDGTLFAAGFAVVVLGYFSGVTVARRKAMSWGGDRIVRTGVLIALPAALVMLASMATGFGGGLGVILPMAVYQGTLGLIQPMSNAAAMMPFKERAGAASSLFSVIQMTLAALAGTVVGLLLDASMLALPGMLVLCAAGMIAVVLVTRIGRS